MTVKPEAANSGFNLEKVYFPIQSHQLTEAVEGMPEEPSVQFGWDWKIVDAQRFEVSISLTIGVAKKRPEETKVAVCGIFAVSGDPQSVAIGDFVRLQGPAILLPYAREAISSMTGRSFYGSFNLPPLNVVMIMADLDPSVATGARQLNERAQSSKRTGALQG